ncbi:trypsin-like peptidase domain-containing protein [Streptomyces sp. SAI-127]|uniref:trypsin-like peptidase domain-containing protein n=1 Tax=Streptomyces sp. SAI-127 TaxID=2940543 RepID=UPI002474C59A|nr:trypsin-like peptidase domain-containing protein [Streptomyces sp. SAI-127]MDH6487512.1 putative serine protease PepD [Streptomyces sp. SAI-127]
MSAIRDEGDFELRAPLGGANAEGDYELPAPSGLSVEEGDYELTAPRDSSAADGEFALARPVSAAALPTEAPATDTTVDDRSTEPVDAVGQAPAEPATDRPEPAHVSDSTSTPPYGVPGPWAPAPPVQHPATAPPPGTAIPTPPPSPAHGTPVARGTVTSGPPEDGGVAVPEPQGSSAPAPPPSPAYGMPVARGAVTSGPPEDGGVAVPEPQGSSAPAPPPSPAYGMPVARDMVTSGAREDDGSPTPTPLEAPRTPSHSSPVPSSVPAGDDALPAPPLPFPPPTPGTSTRTPWQNYDPWAPVPAPLQQTGAALDTPRRRTRRALLAGALLLALVAGGVGGIVGAYLERNGAGGDVVELPQAAEEPRGRAPDSVAGIAARALPSVVTLHVSGAGESGTGTGFVLDDRGHILTNNHVVEPAGTDGEISVTFHSGDTAKATVVGRDSGYDLAVVEVSDVSGLKPMTLGNSDNVQVGDPVVAIGAPFDLEGTVTSGIISAKERPITAGGESGGGSDVSYVDALQTDAPINPGNSGGPLLDSRARVVGINSAIRSADGGSGSETGQAGSIGLGFAIPVNQAKRVAEELINTGKATHPVIGVTLDMDYTGDGARVGTKSSDGGPAVTEGGPGDRAGLEAGDVITEVDGRRIHSGDELIVKTRAHRPGDRLELTVERDGREKSFSLVLGSSDGD